jgi:hypothetical protein
MLVVVDVDLPDYIGLWGRAVKEVDLSQLGGFALRGDFVHKGLNPPHRYAFLSSDPLVVAFTLPADEKAALAAGPVTTQTLPALFRRTAAATTTFCALLFMPEGCLQPRPARMMKGVDKGMMLVSPDVNPGNFSVAGGILVGVYGRNVKNTYGNDNVVGAVTHPNPLFTIATDLDTAQTVGAIKLRNASPTKAPDLGVDLEWKHTVHKDPENDPDIRRILGDGPSAKAKLSKLVRGRYEILTEAGGILLVGQRMGGKRHQPVFLDVLLQVLDDQDEDGLRELSRLYDDQAGRMAGMAEVMRLAGEVVRGELEVRSSAAAKAKKKPKTRRP